MKNICRILLALVLILSFVLNLFFAYKIYNFEKKSDIESIENNEIEVIEDFGQEENLVPIQVEKFVPTVVLSPSAGLNLFGRDEKMHKIASLSKGDVFNAVYIDDNLDEKMIDTEKYIHGISGNIDYWIFSDYLAVNAKPSLVIEKTAVYEDKNLTNPKGENVSFATVIATQNETDSIKNEKSAKIFWYDNKKSKVLEGFIDAEKISNNKDDVIVAGIIEKLRVTTRAVPRNELFKKAFALNPSQKMKNILKSEQVEKISYDYDEVVKALSTVGTGKRYKVDVKELMTVDQSKDPFNE